MDENDNLPQRESFRKARKIEKSKHLTSREILRKTRWLNDPLVYWAGTNTESEAESDKIQYRSFRNCVADKLLGNQSGLYAINCQQNNSVNPLFGIPHSIVGNTVAGAAHAVDIAKRYPRSLSKQIENVDTWIAACEQRIKELTEILRAVENRSIAIEEMVWWIGDEARKPSMVLDSDTLIEHIRVNQYIIDRPGVRAATIALGKRKPLQIGENYTINELAKLGQQFDQWPIDLLVRLVKAQSIHEHVDSNLNKESIAAAIAESVFTDPDVKIDFDRWRSLQKQVELTASTFTRRLEAIADMIRAELPHLQDRLKHKSPTEVIQYLVPCKVNTSKIYQAFTPDELKDRTVRKRSTVFRLATGSKLEEVIDGNTPNKNTLDIWQKRYLGLVGRYQDPDSFSKWLEICTLWCPPTHTGTAAFELAIHAAEKLPKHAKALTEYGNYFFRFTLPANNDRSVAAWRANLDRILLVLPHLSNYSAQQTAPLFQNWEIFGHAQQLIQDQPKLTKEIITNTQQIQHWRFRNLIEETKDHSLLKAIIRLGQKLDNPERFTFIVHEFLEESIGRQKRYLFLKQHHWLLEKFVELIEKCPLSKDGEWLNGTLEGAFWWHLEYGNNLSDFLTANLQFFSKDKIDDNLFDPVFVDVGLAVVLCKQDPQRYFELYRQFANSDPPAYLALLSWQTIRKLSLFRNLVRNLHSDDLLLRTINLMRRLNLVCQYGYISGIDRYIKQFDNYTIQLDDQFELPEKTKQQLIDLAKLRKLSGQSELFPKPIAKIVNRKAALEKELAYLLTRNTDDVQVRLSKIQKQLDQPEKFQKYLLRDLERILGKHLDVAIIEWFEQAISKVVYDRWQNHLSECKVDLNDPDWENAILFTKSAEFNQRILRKALRHRSTGATDWALHHPENQNYLADLQQKTNQPCEGWTNPLKFSYQVANEQLTVWSENDILKILQMGNLFGTCLSMDGCNGFSAIANAVEVNKKVLYIANQKGTILGRKLILLLEVESEPVLFGCYSYGSGSGNQQQILGWIKKLFDIACVSLANQIGVRLATEEDQEKCWQDAHQQMSLFAINYFDGFEKFQPWLYQYIGSDVTVERLCTIAAAQPNSDQPLKRSSGD